MTTASTPAQIAAAVELIRTSLDDSKAEEIVVIDVVGRSPLTDAMIIASGRSDRHVGAIAERLVSDLRDAGQGRCRVEGMTNCDWVLVDTGDAIVHIFRPEVRAFYNLEKLWSPERPMEEKVDKKPRIIKVKAE